MLPSVTEIPVQGIKDYETLMDKPSWMMAKYNSRLPVRAHGSTEELQPGKEVFYQANLVQKTRHWTSKGHEC